jgi:hypothetical protein
MGPGVRAVQKGSSYGLGSWDDFSVSSEFDVLSRGGADGPVVTAATCKRCNVPARIS